LLLFFWHKFILLLLKRTILIYSQRNQYTNNLWHNNIVFFSLFLTKLRLHFHSSSSSHFFLHYFFLWIMRWSPFFPFIIIMNNILWMNGRSTCSLTRFFLIFFLHVLPLFMYIYRLFTEFNSRVYSYIPILNCKFNYLFYYFFMSFILYDYISRQLVHNKSSER
jgi:hypothetical protein